MDIKALAKKYEDYMIERRRYYHTCPETSEKEFKTMASMKADFEAMGFTEFNMMKTCNGFTVRLHGGKPGRTIGLRSDIDALPIQEETGLPFASKNPGAMHACGHDNHMAILLGAAKILKDVKDELCGDVVFIVQPAEELATGALNMVKEGALEGVDAVYGSHVWGNFDAPYIDVSAGNRMACCHSFKIDVEGVAAHGSAPNLGKDALTCSAAIINNLQQIASRQNDPLNPLVVTIGTIHGGSRFNVICNHVSMEGTVRTFSLGTEIEDAMRKIIEKTGETFGMKATLTEYIYMTVPVINMDPELNKIAHDSVVQLYGEEAIGHLPTMMGSEDFSWYSENGKRPYFFSFVGSRNPEKGKIYTNHHEKYDVDEDIIQRGAAVMAQFAANYLK